MLHYYHGEADQTGLIYSQNRIVSVLVTQGYPEEEVVVEFNDFFEKDQNLWLVKPYVINDKIIFSPNKELKQKAYDLYHIENALNFLLTKYG